MKLIIVRHGQTDENVGNGLAARESEVLLNEEGVLQAKKLAVHLKSEKISHAYVSPLQRAVQTADHILQHHLEVELVVAEHLNEQNLGAVATMPKAQWKEIKKASTDPWHLFKAEKGESYQEMQARAAEFFHSLLKNHGPNDTVLVVSHGGTLGVLLLDILEKELTEENYRAHQPKNTEFTVVEIFDNGKKRIQKLNSREHLTNEKV